MENFTIAGIITLVVLMTVAGTHAEECCSAYTDLQGEHHDAMLCTDYCCFYISASFSAGINAKKTCCDDNLRRVPQDQRQEECVKDWIDHEDWIDQHLWVVVVIGVVIMVILLVLCACCCRRCRGSSGIILMPNRQPQTTVMVSSQMSSQMTSQMTNQMTNPAHQGYDQ